MLLFGILNYEKARAFDAYNPRYPAGIAYLAKVNEDYSRLVMEYKNLIQLQPLIIDYYEELVDIIFTQAETEYQSGNPTSAKAKYAEILELESTLNHARKKLSARSKHLKHKAELTLTESLSSELATSRNRLAEK